MYIVVNDNLLKIDYYFSFKNRLKGLMFIRKPITSGIYFKCKSIHTMFMFQKIDVIMTDQSNKILYIYRGLKPWRIIWPKRNVYYTYELPINASLHFKVGQYLKKRII